MKGLNKATKRLADGRRVTYWYAWRGGPKLDGKPGSHEFVAGFVEAHKARKAPRSDTLAALVSRYKASPEWLRNAASTKREWTRWLDRITLDLGNLPFAVLNDPDVAGDFLTWRDTWADRPRTADYAIQVLSRVLGWGLNRRLVKINATEGIEKLYESDRADVIWTPDEVTAYRARAASAEAGWIVPLACLTGLRREDLAGLLWSEVGELAIVKATGKSRGRTIVTVPLLSETRVLLKEIKAAQEARSKPVKADSVLTNTRGLAWTPSGLTHAVAAFGGKRLHDCRGTFATRLRIAGLAASQIADIMGWDGERVERLLSVYVDRDTVVRAIAAQIGRNDG